MRGRLGPTVGGLGLRRKERKKLVVTGGCDKERADDDELGGVERWRGRGLDGEDAERCGGGTRAEWTIVNEEKDARNHVLQGLGGAFFFLLHG